MISSTYDSNVSALEGSVVHALQVFNVSTDIHIKRPATARVQNVLAYVLVPDKGYYDCVETQSSTQQLCKGCYLSHLRDS